MDGAGARRLRNETAEDMDEVRVWGGLRLPGYCIVGAGNSYNQIGLSIISVFNAPLRRFGNHENGGGNETETD